MVKWLLILMFLPFTSLEMLACRYTVREIGFADFGKDSYRLVLFKDERISDSDANMFENISRAALLDANIIVQVLDVKKDTSVLLNYYKEYDERKPNIVLFSPEKRAKVFYIDGTGNFEQTIWDLLEEVTISPARKKLKDNIIKSYGIAFFIEGTNKEENIKARNILNKAIDEIIDVMEGLPHPVNTPPYLITIKVEDIKNEGVLLWSLGWEKEDFGKPVIALMYGRGRRMGPLLIGSRIKEDVIQNMLRFIGEDCECGLDRSWMLGTMIPLRWDARLKAGVLKEHGFDADNPMVISEMSQILSVAPGRVNQSVNTDLLYGYAENVIRITKSEEVKESRKPEEKKQEKGTIQKKAVSKVSESPGMMNDTIFPKEKKTESKFKTIQADKVDKIHGFDSKIVEQEEDFTFGVKDAVLYSFMGLLFVVFSSGVIIFITRRKN
jgi:hypothetical protein